MATRRPSGLVMRYRPCMDVRVAECLLIAKVLVADGIMTDTEKDFLRRAMDALELDEADRARVHDLEGWDEAEPLVAALPADQKRAVVDKVVAAALVDGQLSPHEMDAVEKITAALGLE